MVLQNIWAQIMPHKCQKYVKKKIEKKILQSAYPIFLSSERQHNYFFWPYLVNTLTPCIH